MILNDVHRKSIKHSSVWCRGNLKRHIYSIQKFKATRFIMCDSHLKTLPCSATLHFFFKEHTNRWRYIFPISALTAASTLFVRTSIMLNSLVLLRRGHVQHQPAPLRGHRTNTGPRGRRCVSAGGGASLQYKHLGGYFRTSVGLEREKKTTRK